MNNEHSRFRSLTHEEAMRQSFDTADDCMKVARQRIDKVFGDGHARDNPGLVAAFMQAAAIDYSTWSLSRSIELVSAALSGRTTDL